MTEKKEKVPLDTRQNASTTPEDFKGEVRRFAREARIKDDKPKFDAAMRTPKPGGRVTGPLFPTATQRELFPDKKEPGKGPPNPSEPRGRRGKTPGTLPATQRGESED